LIPKKFATPNLKPTNRPETSKNRKHERTNRKYERAKYRKYERGSLGNYQRCKYERGYLGTIKDIGISDLNWDFRLGFCSLVRSASLLREYATLTLTPTNHPNAHKPTKPMATTIFMCGAHNFHARLNILSIYRLTQNKCDAHSNAHYA